ncbi:hypothetical protein ACHEUQ_03275 [Alloscardovia omnicolens]|uniref:hypothetical protein n=1 Tax=Alloscardovia omnicolens TaxID=419015 RepID=UPI000664F7DB|nr:hypothetical protein [Alloscardovia omnicolens]
MVFPLAPIALDNIIVALITGIVSFAVAYSTARATQANNAASAEKIQAELEGELRKQLAETDKRVGELSHLVSAEQRQRRHVESKLYELEQSDNVKTAYVRAIGHWLGGLCGVLDESWMDEHPKPKLPDEIRAAIERTAEREGLSVEKDKTR